MAKTQFLSMSITRPTHPKSRSVALQRPSRPLKTSYCRFNASTTFPTPSSPHGVLEGAGGLGAKGTEVLDEFSDLLGELVECGGAKYEVSYEDDQPNQQRSNHSQFPARRHQVYPRRSPETSPAAPPSLSIAGATPATPPRTPAPQTGSAPGPIGRRSCPTTTGCPGGNAALDGSIVPTMMHRSRAAAVARWCRSPVPSPCRSIGEVPLARPPTVVVVECDPLDGDGVTSPRLEPLHRSYPYKTELYNIARLSCINRDEKCR